MFPADGKNSVKMYKRFLWKVEQNIVDKLVRDTCTNFLCILFIAHSTQILKVLPKLMPLLRVCIKVNMCENWIFRNF